MPSLNEVFASTGEAAKILDIHPFAVQRLIQRGQLPGEKIANRWLVPREALEKFAETYEGRRGRPRVRPKRE